MNYQSKINILQILLSGHCKAYAKLSSLPTDNLNMLKFRYEKMVKALAECEKRNSKGNLLFY